MQRYQNDNPVTGSKDEPDLLERKNFIDGLCDVIESSSKKTSYAVSIEGVWGCGKTSILNMLSSRLSEADLACVVNYNPWVCGRDDDLVKDFLLQLAAQLSYKFTSDSGKKIANELLSYSSLFNVLKLIPGAEPAATIVEGSVRLFGRATKEISDLKSLDINQRKNKISDLLLEEDNRVVIVIDDIDRLTPKECFDVLRIVTVISDFPNVVFILAFDPAYLTNVLASNSIDNSREYIDKIVQLRLPVPMPARSRIDMLMNLELESLGVSSLASKFTDDSARLSWVYGKFLRYLIRTPRDVKRIANHLRFVLAHTSGEVCFTDLLSLSVLAVRANPVYEHIKNNAEAYLGLPLGIEPIFTDDKRQVVDEAKVSRELVLSSIDSTDKKFVSGLISQLFPLVLDKTQIYSSSRPDYDGRVSSPDRLHVALSYSIVEGLVSQSSFDEFMEGSKDRSLFLEKIIKDGNTERFFNLLNSNIQDYRNEAIGLIGNICEVYFQNKEISQAESFFTSSPLQALLPIAYTYFSDEEKILRHRILKALVGNEACLPLTARLLTYFEDPGSNHHLEGVTAQNLSALKVQFLKSAFSALRDRKFSKDLEEVIVRRCGWIDPQQTKLLVDEILSAKDGLPRIAYWFRKQGSDSQKGDYCSITKERYGDFVNFDSLVKLANKNIESVDDLGLKACLLSIINQRDYYLVDASRVEH